MSSVMFKRVVAALALSGLTVAGQPIAQAQTTPVTFNIAGITDFHGHIETLDGKEPGAGVLACMLPVAAEGNEQLFVSSGDNIGGSAFISALLDDEPTIAALNEMGLDVSAVGNHEFDAGYADLAGRVNDLADFEYVGANVNGESPELAEYVVKDVAGLKVAFVGSVTDTTASKVAPSGIVGITFGDPYAATNAAADKIKANGEADIVVALVHEGYSTPAMFNKTVDIAMGGDSHLVDNQVIDRTDGSKFALVQADHYGKGLADLDITFDPATKKITDIKADVISAEAMFTQCGATPVPAVQAIVDAAKSAAEVKGNETVATIGTDFFRGANADGKSGGNRGTESTLSNLIAEATKQYVGVNTSVKPDLGVMNAGGVRDDLLQGDVTYAEAFAVQPFGNELTYASYTGAKLKEALEQQWKDNDPTASRPILHLGWSDNFTYTYDPTKPWGERVTSMSIDGKPVDMAKEYVVAGSTFLLGGGDGFTAFGNETSVFPNTGIMDVDAFIGYLKANPTVEARGGQSNVGVTFDKPLVAGETVTIDLSSLIYTLGDSAKTVTVNLAGVEATADIDTTIIDKLPESGKATVTVEVPKEGDSAPTLTITTDAGTDITMPVEIEGYKVKSGGSSDGTSDGSSGSSAGSSLGGGLLAVLGIFGALGVALHTALQFNPQLANMLLNMLPVQVREQLKAHHMG
ncbi:Endonuclease YhcR precursor [Corynebacterium kalinowskii]|uniref:Endonuclease YhcR n=1 Tax=Corynebacterium kalinowskii TaxID=2675216 RepID=A0A6B8VTP4_9CORY|nr:bifunctional UDP-sugar hydrolase/5'-nucleotidase [Corynebacterium kalinowskii]QGU02136.1 Endonuclease YhcR precursor [Corynebacterium kalinowskii]